MAKDNTHPDSFQQVPENNLEELQIDSSLFFSREGFGYIYHLVSENNVIVYVGQTKKSLFLRIGAHIQDGKKFFKVFYKETPINDLNEEEAAHIIAHNPILNHFLPPNKKYINLETHKTKNKLFKGQAIKIKKICKKRNICPIWKAYFLINDLHLIEKDLMGRVWE